MTTDPQRIEQLRTMPYDEYLLTPEWQLRREQALERAEHRCMVCYTTDNLNVHHRTYERRGNELESDLTVLCVGCHELYHRAGKLAEANVQMMSMDKATMDYMLHLDKTFNHKNTPEMPYGYDHLDYLTSGLQRSHLSIVAGLAETGKKALALHAAYTIAQHQKHVLYVSLSLNHEQVMARLLAADTAVSLECLQKGFIDDEEWACIFHFMDDIKDLPLTIIDAPTMTLTTLRTTIEQYNAKHGPVDCVIIDNYALLTPEQTWGNQIQQMKLLTRGLKLVARTYNIPVLVLCTLAQIPPIRYNKPTIEDLQQICMPELANDILLLSRDELQGTNRPGIVSVNSVKGNTGEVMLHLVPSLGRLDDVDISLMPEEE